MPRARPKCGVIAAVAAARAMTPKTTSKPATSEVVVSSRLERCSRRSPSARVRANISCGSGASSGWSVVSGSAVVDIGRRGLTRFPHELSIDLILERTWYFLPDAGMRLVRSYVARCQEAAGEPDPDLVARMRTVLVTAGAIPSRPASSADGRIREGRSRTYGDEAINAGA